MNILLLGEYSGLHYNLAEGLKQLGHKVTIASDGDTWKNYDRDIDLNRNGKSPVKYVYSILKKLHLLKGYDIVQLINPAFIALKPNKTKPLFDFLLKNNGSVFLGANGTDTIYMKYGLDGNYKRSMLNEEHIRNNDLIKRYIKDHTSKDKERLNNYIAEKAKGITAVCTEYYLAYKNNFAEKLTFIPLPIQTKEYPFCNTLKADNQTIKFFIGHLKDRSFVKGTDIINNVLDKLKHKQGEKIEVNIANGIPYNEYTQMLNNSHILCDQLYSYGCGLNGVLAMSKGLIVAGGATSEMYELMQENNNHPIIELPVNEDKMLAVFENIVENKHQLFKQAKRTREFAVKHHDHIKVAKEYLDFWQSRS